MRVQAEGRSPSGAAIAYEMIKSRILSGEFSGGDVLVEQALSAQLGLSRTPIREALQALRKEGLVRIDRHRGASVAELHAADIRDLYDLRVCLERHSIEEAFGRGATLDLAPIDEIIMEQADALEAGDRRAFLDADRRFHTSILAWHGNARIEDIMLNVWDHVVRGTFLAMRSEPRQVLAFEEHQALVEALRASDCERAVAASRTHLLSSMRRVLLGGDGA